MAGLAERAARAALFCALLAAAPSFALAEARLTRRCNTTDTNMVWLYMMNAETQARLAAAANDPAREPALHDALWRPLRAETSTSVLENRSVILHMDPFQDVAEIAAAMRTDPLIRAFNIGYITPNGRACFAALPPAQRQTMTEYHNDLLGHYFLSSTPGENAAIDSGAAGPGWRRTGESFLSIVPDACYGTVPVFRFYGPGPNSHFFTADAEECGGLRAPGSGWIPEGVAFGAQLPVEGQCARPDHAPVYRLYNNRWTFNDSNHRFTTSLDTYRAMTARGWIGEGVALCVSQR